MEKNTIDYLPTDITDQIACIYSAPTFKLERHAGWLNLIVTQGKMVVSYPVAVVKSTEDGTEYWEFPTGILGQSVGMFCGKLEVSISAIDGGDDCDFIIARPFLSIGFRARYISVTSLSTKMSVLCDERGS